MRTLCPSVSVSLCLPVIITWTASGVRGKQTTQTAFRALKTLLNTDMVYFDVMYQFLYGTS